MATSGSTNYNVTADDIIKEALELINAIPIGASVPSRIFASCMRTLNLMCKTWQIKDKKFIWQWTSKTGVTIVADQASYTIGPAGYDITLEKPLLIPAVWIRETTDQIDIQLEPIAKRSDYKSRSAKTSVSSSGFPTEFYYDNQRAYGELFLLGVPDSSVAASYTLNFDYPRRIEDFDDSADDADFAQELYETLTTNLAVRLRPKFPATTVNDITDLIQHAGDLYRAMRTWTEEPEENDLVFEPGRD